MFIVDFVENLENYLVSHEENQGVNRFVLDGEFLTHHNGIDSKLAYVAYLKVFTADKNEMARCYEKTSGRAVSVFHDLIEEAYNIGGKEYYVFVDYDPARLWLAKLLTQNELTEQAKKIQAKMEERESFDNLRRLAFSWRN